MSLVDRIWSGGQTGADRGGLDGGLDLGIEIDGWATSDRRAEDGRIPDRYPMRLAKTPDYPTRTGLNIESTDATIVLTVGAAERGSAMTIQLARQMARPCMHIDLGAMTDVEAARRVRDFVTSVATRLGRAIALNVAGNRDSVAPGIGDRVARVVRIALGEEEIDARTVVVNMHGGTPYDVYCGRAGHGFDGYFGNAHEIGVCPTCGAHHDRAGAIAAFERDFFARVAVDYTFRRRLAAFYGKKLGCFCKPLPCHCDVYARWLDGIREQSAPSALSLALVHAHHAPAIARGADCTRCALYGCGNGPVPSQVVENAPMGIGGEAPGGKEVTWGANFVGWSGDELGSSLLVGGQHRDGQTVANVIGCRPTPPYSLEEFMARAKKRAERAWQAKKRDEIESRRAAGEEISEKQAEKELDSFVWEADPIERCRGRFERDLDETNPRVFLAVGKYALAEIERYLIARGLLVESEELVMARMHGAPVPLVDGRFLFATYHPAYAAHDGVEDEMGEREPSKIIKFIRANIARAAAVATRGWINWSEPEYLIAPPAALAVRWLRWVRTTGAELVLDLETCDPITGRPSADQYSCDIRVIGTGVTVGGSEYVMVVPFRHMDGTPWEYTQAERELLWAEYRLTFDAMPLAAHNGYAFDTEVLLTDVRGPERAVVSDTEDAIARVRKMFERAEKKARPKKRKRPPKKRKKETDAEFAVRAAEWARADAEATKAPADIDALVRTFVADRLAVRAPQLLSDRRRLITDTMLLWSDTPDGDMPKALSFAGRATFEVPAWKTKEDIASTDNANDPKCMTRCARDVLVPMRGLPIWRATIEANNAVPQYKVDEKLGRIERDIGSLGMCIDERVRGFWSLVLGRESDKLREKWVALVGRNINPNSVPQLRELFYGAKRSGGWDLDPPLTTEGKEWNEEKNDDEDGSTGAPAVIAILEHGGLDRRQIDALKTLLELKTLTKQKSTYIDNAPVRPWPDEKAIVLAAMGSLPARPAISWLRPTNSMGRTPVARSAARKPAEQQRPKLGRRIYLDDDIEVPDTLAKKVTVDENGRRSLIANMRTIIIPAPGHELQGADYSGSHLRIYAAQAGDRLLYWAFDNKYKNPKTGDLEDISAHGLNMASFLVDADDDAGLFREYERIMYFCGKDEKEYWLFVPKRAAFAFIYGAFPKKVYQTMHAERKRETGLLAFPDISLGDTETWYDRWHGRHPETRPWQADAYAFYAQFGFIASPILDERQRHGPLDANQIPNHRVLAMEGSLHKRALDILDTEEPPQTGSRWTGSIYDGHDSIIRQCLKGHGERTRRLITEAMAYEWRKMKFMGKAKHLLTAGDL